jgi:hypothetical protein
MPRLCLEAVQLLPGLEVLIKAVHAIQLHFLRTLSLTNICALFRGDCFLLLKFPVQEEVLVEVLPSIAMPDVTA